MITEQIKADVLYYMLSGISIVVVQYPGGRIEYTRYFTAEDNFYFLWYCDVDDKFNLNKEIMVDLSIVPLNDENEDQWFQLSCAMDTKGDPYVLRAVQQYCKDTCSKFDATVEQNVFYPITIDVQRHS